MLLPMPSVCWTAFESFSWSGSVSSGHSRHVFARSQHGAITLRLQLLCQPVVGACFSVRRGFNQVPT